MAEETKPTLEGQDATAVAEPEVLELTQQELLHKLDTDIDFANAYLKGDIKIEPPSAEPDAPAAVPEATPAPTPAAKAPEAKPATPEPAKPPEMTKSDDGKFVVDFGDGRKPLEYKTKGEALKAIREKENYIQRQKNTIEEFSTREQALKARIQELEKAKPPAEAPAPAVKKADEKLAEKAEEILDPFDPEYQKKLAEKVSAQEEMIRRLMATQEADKKERDAEKAERAKREQEASEREERKKATKAHFTEANQFVGRHPEFNLGRPVESVDEEYGNFLKELGTLAGTDGSLRQNVAMVELFRDSNSDHGKRLRDEAEKIGLRLPENVETYFKILHINDQRSKLIKFDEVSKKQRPFTFEETYRYLRAQEDPTDATPAPAVETPKPEDKNTPLTPKAQAIAAAEAHKRAVASDIPSGATGQPVDVSQMSQADKARVMDWPIEAVRNDPHKRSMYEAVFRSIGVAPPRLDG